MNDQVYAPLRIALLTNDIAPYSIGMGIAELYGTLAEGLGRAGHHVTVIGIDVSSGQLPKPSWGEIISLPTPARIPFVPRSLQNAFIVARELLYRRDSFDVVECASWPGLSAFVLNARLPTVVRLITSAVVDSDIGRVGMVTQFALEWLAVRRATLVFVSTDYIREKAQTLYRCNFKSVIKIPLGIEDIRGAKLEKKQDAIVTFLVIAAATKRKGTDVLLRALEGAAKRTDAFKVTLIGPTYATYDGYIEANPELEPVWRNVVSTLGGRLDVRHGVSEEEKMRSLEQADYLLMPSRSESFGIPVIEAMRSAVPVISSRGGALSEVSGASDQNLFYDNTEDFEELARVLVDAIARGPRGEDRRRDAARQAYERNFTSEKFVERSVLGYRKAIVMKPKVRIRT